MSLTGTTDAIQFLMHGIRGDQISCHVISAIQLSTNQTTCLLNINGIFVSRGYFSYSISCAL